MNTATETHDPAAHDTPSGLGDGALHANSAVDPLADRAHRWREEAAPVVSHLGERAADAAHQGAQWVRESSERARQQVSRISDRAVGQVRDEPVRSVLMAAAAGALLYALARLLASRSR
jgi:ElaB/YqjD/DUF883 family membrane-anchored ribosome-binding protein